MILSLPINPIGASRYLRQGQFQKALMKATQRITAELAVSKRPMELYTGVCHSPTVNVFGAVSYGEPVPGSVTKVEIRAQIPPHYSEDNVRWLLAGELAEAELANYWPDAMSLADVIIDCLPLLPQHKHEIIKEVGKGCRLRTRQELALALATIHDRFPDRPEYQAIGLYGDGSVVIPEHYNLNYLRKVLLTR